MCPCPHWSCADSTGVLSARERTNLHTNSVIFESKTRKRCHNDSMWLPCGADGLRDVHLSSDPPRHNNARIRLLPCLCNSCPLGQVRSGPIRMLLYSLQLPNQRRWWNQWSGWILTGIWNEHQPQGSMCLRLCVFVCGSVRGWRGSTFARTATLSAGAVMDRFWEMIEGGGSGRQNGC